MKTELLHSYSSNSLANLSRVYSTSHLNRITRSADTKSEKQGGEINSAFENDDGSASGGGTVRRFNTRLQRSASSVQKYPGGNNTENNDDGDDHKKSGVDNLCRSICRKKMLYKKFPVLKWAREYNTNKLLADIISGITIGLTILPQGLAYAKIAGLPPQYGLYSGFVGCFLYIIFGGCKVVTIGPTAILGIITLSYSKGQPAEYVVFLSFWTGLVTFLAGIFQLGFLVNFISIPVFSAFTSSAALTICSTQIKPLLGLTFKAEGFRETFFQSFRHISDIKYRDALLSMGCVIVLLFMQNLQSIFKCWTRNYPKGDRALWFISTSRSVVVILVCTIIFSSIDNSLFPVGVVGDIVPGLPPVQLPAFSMYRNVSGEIEEISFMQLLNKDLSALIVLPLLALMEHITIAKKFSGTSMLDSSQEMIAIGLTNVVGCCFSSMPVTGSFSRSTVNAASGAESPLGGLVTGTLVILALQFLTPYFYYIPDASLAAVIFCAVIFTVDFRIVLDMWRSKRMDLIPWGATFFVSLFVALEVGILLGIIISVIFLLYYSARPAVRIERAETSMGNEFVIVCLDRSLVFPSVEYIRYMVMKSRTLWAQDYLPVVINCQFISFVDFSASQGIRDLFTTFNEKNHPLILWKAKPSVIRILRGLMDSCNVPFQFCMTDDDLERAVDGGETGTCDGDDKPIEFIASPCTQVDVNVPPPDS